MGSGRGEVERSEDEDEVQERCLMCTQSLEGRRGRQDHTGANMGQLSHWICRSSNGSSCDSTNTKFMDALHLKEQTRGFKQRMLTPR